MQRSRTGAAGDTGIWGEKVARRELSGKGYRIIGQRVQLDARTEIDIVARDGETLVFVEVKTRKGEGFGRPAESVNRRKRHALSRAAVRYLKMKSFPQVNFRFDVVEVVGEKKAGGPPIVRHIENAFPLDRRYYLP
jgi:putative endonuclease